VEWRVEGGKKISKIKVLAVFSFHLPPSCIFYRVYIYRGMQGGRAIGSRGIGCVECGAMVPSTDTGRMAFLGVFYFANPYSVWPPTRRVVEGESGRKGGEWNGNGGYWPV
jgi:hypothetical protein